MSDNIKIDVRKSIVRVCDIEDKKVLPFKNQDFQKLKEECLKNKKLFEDPLFPAVDKSMFYTQHVPYGTKWKRPFDLTSKPQFIVGEANAHDLDQGYLGNCWFIAGCAAIVLVPELFTNVVPNDQSFESDYAGIFHFRFWYYGQWVDVVVDDRLPVRYNNKLLFCSNREEPNEFWAGLLEKAYAKLCGCYENLDGGMTTDALVDMTGGIQEAFEINKKQTEVDRNEMWHILVKSRQHKSLIGASIAANPTIREARLRNGLVMGHAYTVTRIACIEVGVREIRLIRLRNPWGNEAEWRGAWNDNSYEWNAITRDVKEALDYRKLPDGEFWMSYEDFYRNFEAVEFCELTPDAFSTELKKGLGSKSEPRLTWKLTAYNGEWIPGKSSGGSGNSNPNAFWTNPQFLITLTDADPDDNENMATIIISLLQKYTRERRIQNQGQPSEEFIQFRLYRILNEKDAEEAKKTGQKLKDTQLERCAVSGPYINAREVTHRFRTKPGNYLVIPSCYDSNISGEFLLRVYTESPIDEKNCSVLHRNDPFFKSSNTNEFNQWSNLMTRNTAPLNSISNNRETRNDYQRLYSTSMPRESSLTQTLTSSYSSTRSSHVYDFRLYDTTLDILSKVNIKKN